VIVDWRLAEIHRRYGSGHLVSRSIHRATPMILDAVDEVQAKSSQNCLGPLRSWGHAGVRLRRSIATKNSWVLMLYSAIAMHGG